MLIALISPTELLKTTLSLKTTMDNFFCDFSKVCSVLTFQISSPDLIEKHLKIFSKSIIKKNLYKFLSLN